MTDGRRHSTVEEAVSRLPTLVQVIDAGWLLRNGPWYEAETMPPVEYYDQADEDLARLSRRVPLQTLVGAYRHMLRDRAQLLPAIYEIHGAALLGETSTRLRLHVPRNEGTRVNFDVEAEIAGHIVNADCKTRWDDFPFNVPPKAEHSEERDQISGYFGSRPTIDPHDAEAVGLPAQRRLPDARHKDIPESSVVRSSLADALTQMPDGINLAILGQAAGSVSHLERTLYGAEIAHVHPDPSVPTVWARTPTGIFGRGPIASAFERLSGVLWMRLWTWGGPLGRAYRLYENPDARHPMTAEVSAALRQVMDGWERTGD